MFVKYVQYLMEEEQGEDDEHERKLTRQKRINICTELEKDNEGYPLLPDSAAADTAAEMKYLVRSFITMHYGEIILLNII